MWRRNMSASIQNSSASPCLDPLGASDVAAKPAVLGLAGRERGEVVLAEQRRGAAIEQRAVELAGPPERRVAREHAARAAREHAVAVRAAARVAARVKALGRRLGAEHRDVVVEQPVQAQRIDRLVAIAGHLPPGVHAADRCARRPSASAAGRRRRSRRAPCAAHARPRSCTVRSRGWRPQPAKPGAVVLQRQLRDHLRSARRRSTIGRRLRPAR